MVDLIIMNRHCGFYQNRAPISSFDGLDLTFETIDGIIKHNGPIRGRPTSLLLDLQV